jgi:hypothetical protein
VGKEIDGCTSSSVNPPPSTEPHFALPYLQDPAAGIHQQLHDSLLRPVQKNQLDAQLILNIYFFDLYMFRAYLSPSSGGTTAAPIQPEK